MRLGMGGNKGTSRRRGKLKIARECAGTVKVPTKLCHSGPHFVIPAPHFVIPAEEPESSPSLNQNIHGQCGGHDGKRMSKPRASRDPFGAGDFDLQDRSKQLLTAAVLSKRLDWSHSIGIGTRKSNYRMITVQDLRKSYGQLVAVDGISFTIAKGETFGLLGPNGAGKTTTINIVLGALSPDSGSVRINGAADPTRAEVRRMLGAAPQSLAMYEDLTAHENLAFFGRLYGLKGKHLVERIAWALEFAGLEGRRADRVKTYSGGMQRRLNLVAGIMHDPPVILMDEPTVGIDPQSRNQIYDSIESLKRQGRTIIYTTHYMEEAQRLCDRVAIIDCGKILALDTVDALIRQYGGSPTLEIVFASTPLDSGRLPGRLENKKLRISTDKPLELLTRVSEVSTDFSHVAIERADLETVFLNLTGRTLRD
jgi:ABC-2 type transport system ATP-binding protein